MEQRLVEGFRSVSGRIWIRAEVNITQDTRMLSLLFNT